MSEQLLKGDNNEALRFLRWYCPGGPWVVTAIKLDRQVRHPTTTATFNEDSVKGLMDWLTMHNGKDNCYFMVNPARGPLTKKATKEDVESLAWLHVDCDPPKDPDIDLEAARAEILVRLQAFEPKPSVIIDSGGGYQAFWRLDEPVYVGGNVQQAEELEAYNHQLEIVLKGDHCFNIDRIMRLPGTINVPDAKKRAAGRVERVASIVGELVELTYPLSTFTAAPEDRVRKRAGRSGPAVVLTDELPPVDLETLAKRLPPYVMTLIKHGSDPNDPDKYKSRSEAQWAAVCAMVRAGLDDDTIASVLLDAQLGISEHPRSQKSPKAYAARQIERARAENEGGVRLTDFSAYMPMHSYIFMPAGELWPSSSVNSRIPPVSLLDPSGAPITNADGEPKTIAANVWLDQHHPVEQMTWAPGEPQVIADRLISEGGWIERPGCNVFNLYRPPKPISGDAVQAEPWLDLFSKVYPENVEHMLNWLAHRVQRPEEKINHALVMGGAQGIGKDTLLEPLKDAVGRWNFVEVSPHNLLGRFNGFVKAVILRVSEARDLGDVDRFAFYDHTKIYTAAPPDVLRVDEKHLREYAVFNVCGVIITSNHKSDGLYLPEDDRRHFVAWSDLERAHFEEGYWKKIWSWYHAGGIGHVAAFLAQRDISGFDPKAPPPKTNAFWDIVASNSAPEAAELNDALEQLKRPDVVTVAEVIAKSDDSFADWLRDRRNARRVPHKFEECGYRPVRNPGAKAGRWKVNGKDVVVYARRELSIRDAIALIARKLEGRRDLC